jgi:hypothetical protein
MAERNLASKQTIKKTLAIYKQEILKDKKSLAVYSVMIPINRLLYLVIFRLYLA